MRLVPAEGRQEREPRRQRARHGRRAQTLRRRAGQGPGDQAEAKGDQGGAQAVQPPGLRIGGLGDGRQGQDHRPRRQRQVDEEDRPPADMVHQPAAHHRTDRGGHRAEPRPGPDGAAALGLGERSAKDRQAGRREQRRARPLQRPGDHQQRGVRSEAAGRRCQGEQADPDQQHPAPAEPVRRRPAHQDEGAQQQQIGVHHPLHRRAARREVALDGRQGDIDHRAVDEGHAGGQHRGQQDQGLAGFRQGVRGGAGDRADRAVIAGASRRADHAPTMPDAARSIHRSRIRSRAAWPGWLGPRRPDHRARRAEDSGPSSRCAPPSTSRARSPAGRG